MNPFKPQNGPIDRPKRNVYDLSYTSHLTCNFGTLYPVFCKKVSPGDSMSIETTFGLRAQPMIFPVQTKMRADIHYFYVRNRTLWNNFMDFYGKTKEGIVHPYIERPIGDFKTGSIYDYMGVPTTIMSGTYYTDNLSFNPYNLGNACYSVRNPFTVQGLSSVIAESSVPFTTSKPIKLAQMNRQFSNFMWFLPRQCDLDSGYVYPSNSNLNLSNLLWDSTMTEMASSARPWLACPTSYFTPHDKEYVQDDFVFNFPNARFPLSLDLTSLKVKVYWCHKIDEKNPTGTFFTTYSELNVNFDFLLSFKDDVWSIFAVNEDIVDYFNNVILPMKSESVSKFGSFYCCFVLMTDNKTNPELHGILSVDRSHYDSETYGGFGDVILYRDYADRIVDSSDLEVLPWVGTNKQLHINALPYRAYEAIYNSFYRNAQVSPFKLTPKGQPEYNRYVTNLGDGADTFNYQLYQRNYEYDFLTGAFHSPQQGLAPLIGLTVSNPTQTATFQFSSPSINNGATITATTKINDEGQVIGITGYDPNLPQSNIDRLMTAINYGISINDIRQTNSLQRWLEKNIRRGYRYKDQLMSHFGVKVEYNELLMPEFIGGATQDIKTDTIYQMATNESGYLGDFAGRAGVVGSSQHRVSKFCDEAGFIIGIMSIVPTPVYSQVPAGYAFDNNLFDYFFPEFSKIGMQPIFNYQVTPLQSQDKLNDVFGYQRPYWDLIRSIDEVHGEFRTTASGYVIQRQFADTPLLNEHFTQIKSETLNDVFMITNEEVSNQFMGMIHFNVKRKTPIPMFGIPSIE